VKILAGLDTSLISGGGDLEQEIIIEQRKI
jgi:hypothetical protein